MSDIAYFAALIQNRQNGEAEKNKEEEEEEFEWCVDDIHGFTKPQPTTHMETPKRVEEKKGNAGEGKKEASEGEEEEWDWEETKNVFAVADTLQNNKTHTSKETHIQEHVMNSQHTNSQMISQSTEQTHSQRVLKFELVYPTPPSLSQPNRTVSSTQDNNISEEQRTKKAIQIKIWKAICSLIDQLYNGEPPVLRLSTRSIPLLNRNGTQHGTAKNFARYLRVLEICFQNLSQDIVIEKRDLYYQDVPLFGTQSMVDRILGQIAESWGCSLDALSVKAAARGLIYGPVTITTKGNVVTCDGRVTLIPQRESILSIDNRGSMVLLIEKEATFEYLTIMLPEDILRRIIMITGKGFLPLDTLSLLQAVSKDLPLHVLVDADPDGLLIYLTLKYGSEANEWRNLHCPNAMWINLDKPVSTINLPSMIDDKHLKEAATSYQRDLERQFIPLTKRDYTVAIRLLEHDPRLYKEVELRRYLQKMLFRSYKTEIQLKQSLPWNDPAHLANIINGLLNSIPV